MARVGSGLRRSIIPIVATILLLALPSASMGASGATSPGSQNWASIYPHDFADPDVLQYDGTYYAYATQNFAAADQTVNIQLASSSDGVVWTSSGIDALPSLPSWAASNSTYPNKNTWAPSVAYDSGDHQFVMFFTATDTSDDATQGDQCIGMALSSDPTGPFVDASSTPFLCQGSLGGSIDPDVFTDANGNSFLIWKNDGNKLTSNGSATAPDSIWSVALDSELTSVTGDPTSILTSNQSWQQTSVEGVIEGPDMVEVGGVYYLFYSGNDEGTASYSIGYAVCPGGPSESCTDSASNPILTSAIGMSGPGGPSVFVGPSGQLQMAFSAWTSNDPVGYLSGGYRPMYVADVNISGGVPSLAPPNSVDSSTSVDGSSLGYWEVAADGGIFSFGSAQFYGSTGSLRLNAQVVGMTATPDDKGYWLVAADGGVFAFGDAQFYGSTGSLRLNRPIVGMASTPDGGGYWLVASDGGIFAFGNAKFYGSAGSSHLLDPITGMTPIVGGSGYWLVDADGEVLSFGNAITYGQPSSAPGGYRIVGIVGTVNSGGYWLASANGNVARFGDAASYGSAYGMKLVGSIVGIANTTDGDGYWLIGSDGGVFSFGAAGFDGSMGGRRLNAPMVGIAAVED